MTIKDIARLSGYGVSTVSRALNGHPDINEETKAKIQKIVDEYNYTPNQNARELKQSVSKSIIIIVKGSMNLFFSIMIEQIQTAIDKLDISASVHYLDEKADEVLVANKLVREKKPIGIIFLGGDINNFEKSLNDTKIPCVLSTTSAEKLKYNNLSSVTVDDVCGGEYAINYLINKGHKKIGIISGDFDKSYPSMMRFEGAKNAMHNANLKIDDNMHEKSSFSIAGAYEATFALMQRNKDITAIFAMSDIMAIGTIRAIIDMGKRVPEDISVVGFDGIEIANYYNPRITTLVQPTSKISALSVRLLINMIEKKAQSSHIKLQAVMQEGDSVKSIL